MIDLSRDGDVFVLRMDAGENRFHPNFVAAWNRALDEVEKSEGPKALVTIGSGKFYSNGLDLDWMLGEGQGRANEYLHSVLGVIGRVLVFPCYCVAALNGHAFVPVDDDNCMSWCFTHHPTRPLTERELHTMRNGGGIHVNLIPGSFRPVVNKDNDYMIDRVAQKHHKSYCGVKGIAMQDAAIQESMGPIQDRSKENLVSTDNGVIMARQRLRKAGA